MIKPLVFSLDAETAHEASLELLQSLYRLIPAKQHQQPVSVMGLDFPNPVGLAAGLDKNGDYLDGLSRLGFGFIEIGTVTPRAQPGNPRPRLFRIPSHNSIINRMGFNNQGVDYLLERVRSHGPRNFILGINIGKNLTTAVENALDDYRLALSKAFREADYITVNISSPNTPGLRKLQGEEQLKGLLSGIHQQRQRLQDQHQFDRPIALKVAPDLDRDAISLISELLQRYSIDALIATNTTIDRNFLGEHPIAGEAGGLSGEALKEKSREILFQFHNQLQGAVPIISAGGIDGPDEACLRLELGASLIQIYSALIFKGPGLVRKITGSLS